MKRVKDTQGNIIPGLFKDSTGALVVRDAAEFHKYKRQQQIAAQQAEQIKSLTDEVSALKDLVGQLIKKIGTPTNG